MNAPLKTIVGNIASFNLYGIQGGHSFVRVRIASTSRLKTKTSERQFTTWYSVVIWDDNPTFPDIAGVSKGDLVRFEGTVSLVTFAGKDGDQRQDFVIRPASLKLLWSKPKANPALKETAQARTKKRA